VIKFATPHAPIRTLMHRFGLYRAEVEVYRQLSADAGIPTPRCYYAGIDTDTGYFVLVMEDMTDSRVGDPLRHCGCRRRGRHRLHRRLPCLVVEASQASGAGLARLPGRSRLRGAW